MDKEKSIFALQIISENYFKTLLVNISDYTFDIVSVPDDEKPFIKNNKIADYWNWFCSSDLIHDDDRQDCIEYAEKVKFDTHLLYRRKVAGVWRWVLMELTKPKCYKNGKEYCVCYVRDIDKIYKPEYEHLVERFDTVDKVTGLYNKFAFIKDRESLKNKRVGVLYADLNGLKVANDTLGHAAGDKLIQTFSGLLKVNFNKAKCYRLGGDEFAVIAHEEALNYFEDKVIAFKKTLWLAHESPMASLGYAIGNAGEFDLTVEKAEKEMYDDKMIFYQRFPKFKR